MKFKKSFLICMILLVIFSLGVVCAEDNTTSDDLGKSIQADEQIQIEDTQITSKSNDIELTEDNEIQENVSGPVDGLSFNTCPHDPIYPWTWADSDGDSGPGIDIWVSNRYPEWQPSGNTTIYFNGEIVEVIPGAQDYLISENYIWNKYTEKGEYSVNVVYSGDEHFNPVNITEKHYISNHECYIENSIVYVRIPSYASGDLTVKANGKTYTKKVKPTLTRFGPHPYEVYKFELKGLKTGIKYTVEINFKGNSHTSFSESLITYHQIDLLIDVFLKNSDDYYESYEYVDDYYNYGEDNFIVFRVPKDIKNKISFKIDGKSYNYTKTDDLSFFDPETQMAFKVNVSDLTPGKHDIVVSYPKDSKYPSFSIDTSINVLTEIKYGEDNTISLSLPDDAKGNLTVEIKNPGESEYRLFDTVALNGQKAIIFLPYSNYYNTYIKAYYTEKDYEIEELYNTYYYIYGIELNYGESMKLRVPNQVNSTLALYLGSDRDSRVPIGEYTDLKTIIINKTFVDDLINTSIAKSMMEENYKKTGLYFIELTSVINSTSGTFELQPITVNFPYKITGLNDITLKYTDSKTIVLNAYDIFGRLVGENETVKIKIATQWFTLKTYKNGTAKINIPNTVTPGNHKITATYKTAKVTKKLTVKHLLNLKTVKVKKSAKKLILQATLSKLNGKYLKNKKITFKFNGKTYKAKTNSKGIAKYTIKKSVLSKLKAGKKVTYQATYLKDTVKKTAKIQK